MRNSQSVYVLRRGRYFDGVGGEGSHEAVYKLHPLVRVRRLAEDARLVEVALALLGAVLAREVEAALLFGDELEVKSFIKLEELIFPLLDSPTLFHTA